MTAIQVREGVITSATPLTDTAKEVVVTLKEGIDCPAGSFVNFFIDVNGAPVRRAYSVVACDVAARTLTFSIRRSLNGTVTTEFWKDDIVGRAVRIMGPMGLNTADKLSQSTLVLCGYGIGAGVIKAILGAALEKEFITKIVLITGSRNENDIIYKDYFDCIAQKYPHVSVRYVVSEPQDPAYPYVGYIQHHIGDYDFNNADVYMCGQEKACAALTETINAKNPAGATFFTEAFH
jgi:phenol/toluene 2-monooxygenase (NADH) P5/A5